jgi:hypothetical protein
MACCKKETLDIQTLPTLKETVVKKKILEAPKTHFLGIVKG